MYVHRVNNGKRVPQYTCSAYSKVPVGTLCRTQHRINADVVLELIKELLRAIAEYSQLNREEFLETVKKAQTSQQSSEITRLKSRLAEAKKRVQELEKLICRIYEDNILGKLPDERYAILDGQYSKEQKDLSAEIADMEAELSGYEEGRRSAEKFIALVDKYQNFDEWKVDYAPRIEDDDWHPLFVEAMEKYTLIEYKMDVLLSGSLEDRARLILDCQEEVKSIEQRIKEESSRRPGCTSGSITKS